MCLVRRTESMLRAGPRVCGLLVLGLGMSLAAAPRVTEGQSEEERHDGSPTPRWLHSAAVVDGKVYVMGGVGADNQPVTSVEVYDSGSATWARCSPMPTARALLAAAVVDGTIYTFGGTTMGLDKLGVVEAYDPGTDTWSRKADLPTPRNSHSAVAVGGRIFVIGGWGLDEPEGGWGAVDLTEAAAFPTVEVYDPETNGWERGADVPAPRGLLALAVVEGKIYAMGGGIRREGQDEPSALVEVYDTEKDRWEPGVPMPTPRFAASAEVVDGRVYVAGGVTTRGKASTQVERERSRAPLSVVEVFDPERGEWTSAPGLKDPRGWHSSSLVNGALHVIGGRSAPPAGGVLEVDGPIPGLEIYAPVP